MNELRGRGGPDDEPSPDQVEYLRAAERVKQFCRNYKPPVDLSGTLGEVRRLYPDLHRLIARSALVMHETRPKHRYPLGRTVRPAQTGSHELGHAVSDQRNFLAQAAPDQVDLQIARRAPGSSTAQQVLAKVSITKSSLDRESLFGVGDPDNPGIVLSGREAPPRVFSPYEQPNDPKAQATFRGLMQELAGHLLSVLEAGGEIRK